MKKLSTGKAVSALIFGMASIAIGQSMSMLGAGLLTGFGVPLWLGQTLAGALFALLVFLLVRFFCSGMLREKMTEIGVTAPGFSGKWIGAGIGLVAFEWAVYFALGARPVPTVKEAAALLPELAVSLSYFVLATAFTEELVLRGLALRCLKARFGIGPAVMFPAALSALPMLNAGRDTAETLIVALAVMLNSVMLAFIALESGSIWNSFAVNVLWRLANGGLIAILAAPAAEQPAESLPLLFVLRMDTENPLLMGGRMGAPCSLIAALGFLAVTAFAVNSISKKIAARKAEKAEAPAPWPPAAQ